ncbi:MAG: cache domain-containing protein [Candidatus Eremiobacteraeota bacterium]|nr:cache domain-containing protein [Candidatus Eremiobacteraeota bacterium]
MNISLRTRLLGTIVGAIILFFVISVVAARVSLQKDLSELGGTEVANGSNAFGGYWDSRREQIRLLITQDAVADALRNDLQAHNAKALQDQLSNIARTSNLSFLTVVDANGKVIARANNDSFGSLGSNGYVRRALTGETVSSSALLPASELQGEGLAPQAATDIKNADGKTVGHLGAGLAIVAAAPMSDQNERTLGAIYGGVLMNHFYDLVDQSTHALGGQTALIDGNAIVASTISQADGTRVVDLQIPKAAEITQPQDPYVGSDTEGGTEYLARIDPILNDQNAVVGARWYGIPMAQIASIQNHLTQTFVLWGLVAMIIALAIAVPIVQRLSAAIGKRSEQVSGAAKELGVTIVGGEVSGDHVTATKAAVERSGKLIEDMARSGATPDKLANLKNVNDELSGDMMVIETLSQEMSERLQHAVTRVAELTDVSRGLDSLVHGRAT